MKTIGEPYILLRVLSTFRSAVCAFLLFACLGTSAAAAAADYVWDGVDRVVAVGDLHGDYLAFYEIMRSASLIDQEGDWIGGNTHLVQTGDIPDRGPESIRIIDHLRRLSKQAKKAGGRVHTLVGNHEAMNMTGDVRFVHPGEYEHFVTVNSARVRNEFYVHFRSRVKERLPREQWPEFDDAYRQEWNRVHPLGHVEHQRAWNRNGKYGRWASKNPAAIRIDGTLFLHGGLSPQYRDLGLAELNKRLRLDLSRSSAGEQPIVDDDFGPLWYRGLALNDEAVEEPNVIAILDRYDVERIVIAHTTTFGPIMPRFGDRVIVIDTGISEAYGGHSAYLVIEGATVTAVYRDQPLTLRIESDTDLLEYLNAAGALVTDRRSIDSRISEISAAVSTAEPR